VGYPFASTFTDASRRAIGPLALACLAVVIASAPLAAQQNDASQQNAAAAQLDPLFDEQPKFTVRVKSGRTFAGYIDTRTDAQTLWLRVEDKQTTLWRPIAWHRVESASTGEQTFSAAELQSAAARLATSENAARRQWPSSPNRNQTIEPARFEAPAEAPAVRALWLDARFANWDADRDDDGLIAAVTPIDDAGRPSAASGTLSVELIGMTGPRTVDYAGIPIAPAEERPTLETWTVQLDAADFLDGTAQVRLPFRNGDPADDPRLQNHGVLRARLNVPGSDVVEAQLDPIRLRSTIKVGSGRN
jgi:hypothetical protein